MNLAEKMARAWRNGVFLEKLFGKVRNFMDFYIGFLLFRTRMRLFRIPPIDKTKILFCNFKGAGYGCNPKYICEALHAERPDLKFVWCVKNPDDPQKKAAFPEWVELVDYRSVQALMQHLTAKVWVDNQRKIYFIRKGLEKRSGQFYFQTFHGSLGIKKNGLDIERPNGEIPPWVPFGKKDASWIDCLASNSAFEDELFRRTFFGCGRIRRIGHARNDIFFRNNTERNFQIRKSFHLPPNGKIVLYVPSYRDTGRRNCFGLETPLLLKKLRERFGGEWVLFERFHPNLGKYAEKLFAEGGCENRFHLTDYPDIQELLAVADCVITDYSSCIFDFLLTGRPGFLFAEDSDEYEKERGLYYPLEASPFPVARNNRELAENIAAFDPELFDGKRTAFLREKRCMEDGRSAKRAAAVILAAMEEF